MTRNILILIACLYLFLPNQVKAQIENKHPVSKGLSKKLANKSKTLTENRFEPEPYVPVSPELYKKIIAMDSIYFDTYNTCNLEKMDSLMAGNLEFYHDKGGLSTSKAEVIAGIKKNICGKVTRELIKGSIEVYPIKDFGAVEIGYHRFHNNTEPEGSPSKIDKFIIIWQWKDNTWKITRVVSLH